MKKDLSKHGQYKNDIFNKISVDFQPGKKILDVGCGDGSDAKIFSDFYNLDTYAIDIYKHEDINTYKKIKFQQAGIYNIPFEDNYFDYVFLHDVLHHIDEPHQRYKKHHQGLTELKRVCTTEGKIIILEANRYNPLFYPHMVLLEGHNHFTQRYFKKIINHVFAQNITHSSFEAHFYPPKFIKFFKFFEFISEYFSFFEPFRSYNLAIIKK